MKGGLIIELYFTITLKLILIIMSSLFIGINRGKKNQFAGMKTHLFVGIGAGLSFIGPQLFYIGTTTAIGDPYRLSAQVISGIGFLGAGTIIKSGQSIRGLTTAASLWCTAIIAITIASGGYVIGLVCSLIIVLFLSYSSKLDITRKYSTKSIICKIRDIDNNFNLLNTYMNENAVLDGNYTILTYKVEPMYKLITVKYVIIHRQTDLPTNDIVRRIGEFNFVEEVDSITEMDKSHT